MTSDEKLIKAIFGDWTPDMEMSKRTITAKEETLKAFSLLNFHHMVHCRIGRKNAGSKIDWYEWRILTDEIAKDLINDTSIEILELSFKPDFTE